MKKLREKILCKFIVEFFIGGEFSYFSYEKFSSFWSGLSKAFNKNLEKSNVEEFIFLHLCFSFEIFSF